MTEKEEIEDAVRDDIQRWRRLASEDHLAVYEGVGDNWCVIVCTIAKSEGHCTATAAHSATDVLVLLTDAGAQEMCALARLALKS